MLDDDQLVVNLKKQDPDVKWPDITETWESLTVGVLQLLKGASIYLVGESSEINYKVSRELAVGLGYVLTSTRFVGSTMRIAKISFSESFNSGITFLPFLYASQVYTTRYKRAA